MKTLCTRCQAPLTVEWPDKMTFGGEEVTACEYMALALRSERVFIACDKCLSEMPTVKVEDLCS